MKLIPKLISAVAFAMFALTSQATIITGDTVNVTHYFPDSSSGADMGNQVVPTANFNYYGIYDVLVSDAYLTLNAYCGQGCTWSTASFNGPVILDLTSASFTDVNIDPSSNYVGFDATRLTFDSNHIYLNLQGLDANGFLRVNFDGNNVPEPDSLLLFGAALAALVVTRQKLSK